MTDSIAYRSVFENTTANALGKSNVHITGNKGQKMALTINRTANGGATTTIPFYIESVEDATKLAFQIVSACCLTFGNDETAKELAKFKGE